jgi:ketosteroid isomerase-like protein
MEKSLPGRLAEPKNVYLTMLAGGGVATDGQPYENSYAWIMKLADGKVIDGAAFYDSLSFNDLWARVQPR